MDKVTLYGKDSKGSLRVWYCFSEGPEVVVQHGKLGGKLSEKRYTAEAKNVGKANESSPDQQASTEAEAKVVKQLKSGYFYTQEEALAFEEFTPMKAHNYNDHAKKVTYPCYMQPKLDGFRLMVDKYGDAWSKQGEPLELPKHWTNVERIASGAGGLDGEVYAGLVKDGGLSLQKIRSAFLTPNETDTPRLSYFVYDIPNSSLNQTERISLLVQQILGEDEGNNYPDIYLVESVWVENEEQGDRLHQQWTEAGYEGSIYRCTDGTYEFGKRSYYLIKRKDRQTAEAIVESVRIDKNGDGVCTVTALNGKQAGKQFEFLMRKDSAIDINLRKYENALTIIGQAVEYEYEDLSDDDVPLKPVGVGLREVLANGEARY